MAALACVSHADTVRCQNADGDVLLTDTPSLCAGPIATRIHEVAPVAPAAPGESLAPPAHDATQAYRGEVTALFVPVEQLRGDWEIVPEEASAVSAEWRSRGVRAIESRHYTRSVASRSEVCSLEIWLFIDEHSAARMEPDAQQPGWSVSRFGNALVMLRGTTFAFGNGFSPGMPESCALLRDAADARVAKRLAAPGAERR